MKVKNPDFFVSAVTGEKIEEENLKVA